MFLTQAMVRCVIIKPLVYNLPQSIHTKAIAQAAMKTFELRNFPGQFSYKFKLFPESLPPKVILNNQAFLVTQQPNDNTESEYIGLRGMESDGKRKSERDNLRERGERLHINKLASESVNKTNSPKFV